MYPNETLPDSQTVMWGIPIGETERYMEVILYTGDPKNHAEVIRRASADGFHSFRTAVIDLTKPPQFIRAISRGRK